MADVNTTAVPNAIYFDANALIGAPTDLATQPIAESIELASLLGADLLIPELAVEEWYSRRCDDAIKAVSQIERHVTQLGTLLGRSPMEWERMSRDDIRKQVRRTHEEVLAQSGFRIISTPEISARDLAQLFLDKQPPFNDGDKGFKDAVIVETIIQHSCRDSKHKHIILVSSDKALGHAAIADRFSEVGTAMKIVDGDPRDLFANLAALLQNALNEARNEQWIQQHELATAFAKKHEKEILDFVVKNATVGQSDLRGYGLRDYGRQKDETDTKLEFARIVSVDAIRPLEVTSAFTSNMPLDEENGRTMFMITVLIEIDLTIATRNLWLEPRVPMESANSLVQPSLSWNHPEVKEPLTVKRDITVVASVPADGAGTGEYKDLKLIRA